jgi:serpin B
MKLTANTFQQWLTELDETPAQEIPLIMPKYKLETSYDLVPQCKRLGIKDAFGGEADFSGMGWEKGELWISRIVHKAYVDVNEEGTEAAAATAVAMVTGAVPYHLPFRADHPFLFMIRHNETGAILFMGRMTNPKSM